MGGSIVAKQDLINSIGYQKATSKLFILFNVAPVDVFNSSVTAKEILVSVDGSTVEVKKTRELDSAFGYLMYIEPLTEKQIEAFSYTFGSRFVIKGDSDQLVE